MRIEADKRSPLHVAALEDDAGTAQSCLDAGEDPDVRDREGFTPLHFAAQEWNFDVARVLIERGATVDSTNDFGNTPLFVAVFNSKGRGELIELLRSHGADPMVANHAGPTPLGLARLIANYAVRQHFADLDPG